MSFRRGRERKRNTFKGKHCRTFHNFTQSRKIAATITKSTTPPVTRHAHRNFGIKFAVFVIMNVRDV